MNPRTRTIFCLLLFGFLFAAVTCTNNCAEVGVWWIRRRRDADENGRLLSYLSHRALVRLDRQAVGPFFEWNNCIAIGISKRIADGTLPSRGGPDNSSSPFCILLEPRWLPCFTSLARGWTAKAVGRTGGTVEIPERYGPANGCTRNIT